VLNILPVITAPGEFQTSEMSGIQMFVVFHIEQTENMLLSS